MGRLPYLNKDGQTYYLHLAVWRANVRLAKLPIWSTFCKGLVRWTSDPLEDFNDRTQLWAGEEVLDVEQGYREEEVVVEEEEVVEEDADDVEWLAADSDWDKSDLEWEDIE